MLICRRAALSTLLVSASDVLLLGSVVCPRETLRLVPAVHARETPSSFTLETVPVPPTWLPPVIDMKSPNLKWKDVVTCCRRRRLDAETCQSVSSSSTASSADGEVSPSDESDSYDGNSCSTPTGESALFEAHSLGRIPQFTTEQTMEVMESARASWASGKGAWTSLTLQERIEKIQKFLEQLALVREPMIQTLMMEIGKNRQDAEAEFDRTIDFCNQVIRHVQTNPEYGGQWQEIGSTSVFIKRSAIGIYLSLAPYNYPLNECYAAVIPCLLMGNVVILKIPTVGGLVHLWTFEAFRKTLPPGTINFVTGSGRSTMPPLMASGYVDGLAFIGGRKAADQLIQVHPHPHRLHVFLQLEANNLGIYLPSVFEDHSLLSASLDQAVMGSLSFNGQRCTALKLHYVPKAHADTFVEEMVKRVDQLNVGLAGDLHENGRPSQITPLPGRDRIEYMQALIENAVAKGATVVNRDGGKVVGGPDSTLMIPAVLYPVTPDMRVFGEEQFGPLVPIAAYSDLSDVLQYAQGEDNVFGQQISIFGSDVETIAPMIDRFASVFGRINLNAQCGRSPDTVPFSGRRSSAMGTMSVTEALREFSIPTVVAYSNANPTSKKVAGGISEKSKFLQPVIGGTPQQR